MGNIKKKKKSFSNNNLFFEALLFFVFIVFYMNVRIIFSNLYQITNNLIFAVLSIILSIFYFKYVF